MKKNINITTSVLVFLAAFALYWETSEILIEYNKEFYFGADTNLYRQIADGQIDAQIRLFHPFTVSISQAWLFLFSPLIGAFTASEVLGGMYAAFGAASVVASYHAFRNLLPATYAVPCTVAYALSLSVWYLSSIHETKIIDAAIAAIYISLYLQLRKQWDIRIVMIMTAILSIGCLNAIVAAFLLAIPAVDIFFRENYNFKKLTWVILHALPVPVIFVFMEVMMGQSSVAANGVVEAEGKNHLDLMLTFAALGDHSIESFFGFLLNWLFFSIAAPSSEANFIYEIWPDYDAYFEPGPFHYLEHLTSGLFMLSLLTMIGAAIFMRPERSRDPALCFLLAGLALYSLLRIILFFIFIPSEALLYSSSTLLCHLIILSVPFLSSKFPYKRLTFNFFLATLLISNIRFLFR